jgi:hypothetical protein
VAKGIRDEIEQLPAFDLSLDVRPGDATMAVAGQWATDEDWRETAEELNEAMVREAIETN